MQDKTPLFAMSLSRRLDAVSADLAALPDAASELSVLAEEYGEGTAEFQQAALIRLLPMYRDRSDLLERAISDVRGLVAMGSGCERDLAECRSLQDELDREVLSLQSKLESSDKLWKDKLSAERRAGLSERIAAAERHEQQMQSVLSKSDATISRLIEDRNRYSAAVATSEASAARSAALLEKHKEMAEKESEAKNEAIAWAGKFQNMFEDCKGGMVRDSDDRWRRAEIERLDGLRVRLGNIQSSIEAVLEEDIRHARRSTRYPTSDIDSGEETA